MTGLIVREFLGQRIRQREDGFLSLTDMAQANGKTFGHWHSLKSTEEYLEALREKHYRDHDNAPIESNVGGSPETTGTWGDRRVALRFAQWISPQFALQVDEWVEELLLKGSASIAPPQRQLAPQRDLLQYMEAAKVVGIDQDPILKSLFTQRMAEELGGVNVAALQPIVLTVRAQQLGISQKDIGTGTKLGKYIAKSFAPMGKSQHGKYEVNVYQPTQELDEAILEFFA